MQLLTPPIFPSHKKHYRVRCILLPIVRTHNKSFRGAPPGKITKVRKQFRQLNLHGPFKPRHCLFNWRVNAIDISNICTTELRLGSQFGAPLYIHPFLARHQFIQKQIFSRPKHCRIHWRHRLFPRFKFKPNCLTASQLFNRCHFPLHHVNDCSLASVSLKILEFIINSVCRIDRCCSSFETTRDSPSREHVPTLR